MGRAGGAETVDAASYTDEVAAAQTADTRVKRTRAEAARVPPGYVRRSFLRSARWALFFALVAGIVAMHGLGHAGHSAPMPAADGVSSLPGLSSVPSLASVSGMSGMPGESISPTAPSARPGHLDVTGITGMTGTGLAGLTGTMGLDPTSVCLAVLAAAVLLPALGGSLMWRRRDLRIGLWAGIVSPASFSGLSPPRKPELSALSVLRL